LPAWMASEHIRLSAASSGLIVAFAAPSASRLAVNARTSAVVMLASFRPLNVGPKPASIRCFTSL
jgi:hypothetical protein